METGRSQVSDSEQDRGSRFTDEQIIGVLREANAGASTGDPVPSPWDLTRDLLQLEGAIGRDGRE